MSERDKTEAFVTLATNDTYSIGCLVLGAALRRVQTTRRLVVMITEGVSNPMRAQLAQLFDVLQEVNLLDSHDPVNLALLGRPDLNVTFTKLHCWRLTQFTKAVFLDADTLVLQNVDELFDREELSAAPDAGWPDCFNSGVFVFRPSQETYDSLLSFATSQGSFDGGDQGLLNMYFKNWSTEDISKHLPFIYNVVSQAFYSYLPAFTQFKDRVKIVHFIGAVKPWHHTFDPVTGRVTPLPGTGHSQEFLEVWWSIFMEKIQPSLDPSLREELSRAISDYNKQYFSDNNNSQTNEPSPCPPSTPQDIPSPPSAPRDFPSPPSAPRDIPSPPSAPWDIPSPKGSEKVPAKYPYKPPDADDIFYDSLEQFDSSEKSDKSDLVEMDVMQRSYSELETHYPEGPLSNISPEEPMRESMYEATRITEGWEAGNRKAEPAVEKNGCEKTCSDDKCPSPVSWDQENDIDSDDPAVLVGNPARLSGGEGAGASKEPVPDAVRKLNWEKGQIDYLGQDSFENIQRKIEETLTSESKPTPTPFAPAPEEKSAPKPVETTKVTTGVGKISITTSSKKK